MPQAPGPLPPTGKPRGSSKFLTCISLSSEPAQGPALIIVPYLSAELLQAFLLTLLFKQTIKIFKRLIVLETFVLTYSSTLGSDQLSIDIIAVHIAVRIAVYITVRISVCIASAYL